MLRHGRLLFLRHSSSSTFNPRLWLAQSKLDPSTQHGLQRFLREYGELLSFQKGQVPLEQLHPSIIANLDLQKLLRSGEDKAVFTHIIEHLSGRKKGTLSSSLIEQYINHLLAAENLNAAVSLIHVVLDVDSESYCISNQTWSFLASRACELGHYSAACLVYHEVIDPITAYSDNKFSGLNNPLVPFLLFPDILAQLAIVLMHNGNNVAVAGIQSYFKRFYSYFWHRTIYRTIALAKVEAHARAGLVSDAISEYVKLAWQHRGHNPLQKGSTVEHNLKYAVEQNLKERQRRIVASDDPLNDPTIEYNKYSIPGKKFNAIFDGVLRTADTPYFTAMIQRDLKLLMTDRSSAIERLVNFITSKHQALLSPVIFSLCEGGLVFEAWAVLNQTKASYPRLHDKILFRGGEVFTILFKAMSKKFSDTSPLPGELRHLNDILHTCRNLCRDTFERGWTYECRIACLQALLACPSTLRQEVRLFLFEWDAESKALEKKGLQFSLDKATYNRLVELNVGDNLMSKVSPAMYIKL